MSGVAWKECSPGARGEVLRVHTVRPGERAVICFLTEANGIAETMVHWIPAEGKGYGVPCRGPDCPQCPGSAQPRRYAAVLRFVLPLPRATSAWTPPAHFLGYAATCWEKSVLEITANWLHITDQAKPGAVFELVRASPHKQGTTRFNPIGVMTVPSSLAFDPKPVIERAWGFAEGGKS
jgi:hypothetical protein